MIKTQLKDGVEILSIAFSDYDVPIGPFDTWFLIRKESIGKINGHKYEYSIWAKRNADGTISWDKTTGTVIKHPRTIEIMIKDTVFSTFDIE
jgi:hypothetical protein